MNQRNDVSYRKMKHNSYYLSYKLDTNLTDDDNDD